MHHLLALNQGSHFCYPFPYQQSYKKYHIFILFYKYGNASFFNIVFKVEYQNLKKIIKIYFFWVPGVGGRVKNMSFLYIFIIFFLIINWVTDIQNVVHLTYFCGTHIFFSIFFLFTGSIIFFWKQIFTEVRTGWSHLDIV